MWDHAATVAVAAFALVLIGFSQTAGDARAFAAKHRYQIDIDQESVAQAVANTGCRACSRACRSRPACQRARSNDHSGARTGLASIVSGVTVLLTLLVLAPLFSDLPKPVLAALIIEAVVMGMMNLPEMRRLARVQRFDFWIAVAAIAGHAGVRRPRRRRDRRSRCRCSGSISVATHPDIPVLAHEPGTQVFREVSRAPRRRTDPGRRRGHGMDGGLFFATSDALEDRIRELIHATPDLTGVVLDCGGINFVDSQGAAKMDDVLDLTDDSGIVLRLARLKPNRRRHPPTRWGARTDRRGQDPRQRPTGRCRRSSSSPARRTASAANPADADTPGALLQQAGTPPSRPGRPCSARW